MDQDRALGAPAFSISSVSDVRWPLGELAGDPNNHTGVQSVQFVLELNTVCKGLDSIEGTREIQEENPHCAACLIQR